MNNATLNGEKEVLSDSVRISVDVPEVSRGYLRDVVVQCGSSGKTRWEKTISNIGVNPASKHLGGQRFDLKAFVWDEGGVLLIAGANKAVALDLSNGEVRLEVPLRFVHQPSLDLLEFHLSRKQVLVFATKTVAAIDLNIKLSWIWNPEGLIRAFRDGCGGIAVEMMDLRLAETPIIEVSVHPIDGPCL